MPSRLRGLYESLWTEVLETELGSESEMEASLEELRVAESADRFAVHLARVVERAIEAMPERARLVDGAALARKIVELAAGDSALLAERPVTPARTLFAIAGRQPDGRTERIGRPLIPLLDTTLLTNAPGEPRVGSQLLEEIESADRIDVVMAFIRRSGINPLLEALRRHCAAGRELRVITTTFTGTTDAAALNALRDIGAKVRVSYDTTTTRLHAKSWLFHRNTGFSTAYIGSSNLTHSAQVSGLEWNVRLSGVRNRSVVDKVAAVFESYWNSDDFREYQEAEFERLVARERSDGPQILLSPIELRPEPFQERLLECLALSREAGHHRNLLVAATGTGKTVMAALDYVRLRASLPRARLLFVAHREEILKQSLATFRQALRDHSFGELWVAGKRPELFEHVFASVQSLNASGVDAIDPKHFDVVIVDEFHHAAASSYDRLLTRLEPHELVGLTATPERSDGLDVLGWFGGRIAAELRLWDAIDQRRLVPFAYYGVHDGTDLSHVSWSRGLGYKQDELTNLYTANDVWARLVVEQVRRHVDAPAKMRALGFCVSVAHAQFMAKVFNDSGVRATAVWADTPSGEREAVLRRLRDGEINAVFSVDLFNEGVDVPAVDTLLMLRPTESATLFLQQLGRGLRRQHGKSQCLVLDFIGHQHADFRFDQKLRALLGGSRSDVERHVGGGFPFLPAGCHMELDRVASEIVLASIENALPRRWPERVNELRVLGASTSLSEFLERTGLELEDVYAHERGWTELRAAAGFSTLNEADETLLRAVGRLLHVDDRERLNSWSRWLSNATPPSPSNTREQRLLRMLVASVIGSAVSKDASVAEAALELWRHEQVREELVQLFAVLAKRVNHVTNELKTREVPLNIHARYSRLEVLSAVGVGAAATPPTWREGVRFAEESNADVLAFTLDKTSGGFSPSTRYRDFAISRELIHWESQSTTRAESPTGRRYRSGKSVVLLFARLRSDDRAFFFLGPGKYVKHEGEMPMAVTWRLEVPLPGDLFADFAAAVS